MNNYAPFHSVIVVGAGIAGLAAAKKLLPAVPDLLLVEAASQRGGRIKQVENILPWPVELGPEFIHGAKTSLKVLLGDMGCNLREFSWPDYWYFEEERRLKSSGVKDGDVEAVTALFEGVGEQPFPAQDMSAEEWLRRGGANDRMVAIADACHANDFCCSIEQLGLTEMIIENRNWDAGETYLVLDRSLASLVQHLGRQTHRITRLNWPVSSIHYNAWGGATLTSLGGERLRCRHLLVTVPISILQRQDILFRPPLPSKKMAVIERIKMGNAVKVIIALERPIWPDGFFDVICPGGFIPEFWVTTYPSTTNSARQQLYGITGFATGKRAEKMSQMQEGAIVQATLAQLDQMFGSGVASSSHRYPATSAYVRSCISDWSKQPFIRGAYSYPTLGAKIGDREALGAPIGNTIFFAGEATHPAVNPCLQAAMETGLRAADEVLAAQRSASSRL